MKLHIRGWKKFQHYKDRCPPWIKLHRTLLDNMDWNSLSDFAARLIVELWLLASESDGIIEMDCRTLAWRLRHDSKHEETILSAVEELINNGFIDDDSGVLAECLHNAIPETEAERETEKRQRENLADKFDQFWSGVPNKIGKGKAREAFERAVKKKGADPQTIIDGLPKFQYYESKRQARDDYTPLHPSTWINQERWADEFKGMPNTDASTALSQAGIELTAKRIEEG